MKNAVGMFVSLMIVLSITGVAVAHWSDSIQIEGTVHMGSLTIGWDNLTCGEENEPCTKDVGSITAELLDAETDAHTGKTIYKTLVFTIDNAYPCYTAWIEVDIKNAGTIPADWENWELVMISPDNMDMFCEAFEISCSPCPTLPLQIDPCNSIHLRCELHVKQTARECTTYSGKLKLNFEQWSCEGEDLEVG